MSKVAATYFLLSLLFFLAACANTGIPGISGMAAISENEYIVVQDAKVYEPDKPRIGLLTIDATAGRIDYVRIRFPADASAPSNDLEGVCRLPNTSNEFLLNESGYWETDYGRIFHIRVSGKQASLVREIKLPLVRDNNESQLDGDQFEGIACFALGNSKVLVLLGERGGTTVYPTGILRWGTYDRGTGQIVWSDKSQLVSAPNPWTSSSHRSITGLSIDDEDRLWASAAVDPDEDFGPFRSLVYLIGSVDGDANKPVQIQSPVSRWVVDGFKIEAVSAESNRRPFSIGTEDEKLNGTWRQLPK